MRLTGPLHRAFRPLLVLPWLLLPGLQGHCQTPGVPEAPDSEAPRVLLVPAEQARFASPVGGRVLRVVVRPGDRFRRGELLVEFDCARQRLELAKSRARLAAADATLESNRRLQELQSIGDLELALSRAQRDEAGAEVESASLELSYCRLEAPWDGSVVARHVNPLESVSPGQPLLEVNSAGMPMVQLYVPSSWLAWLRVGTRFEIDILETGARHGVRLTRLGSQVDAVSQTVEIFGELEDTGDGLLPGMTGTARIERPAP